MSSSIKSPKGIKNTRNIKPFQNLLFPDAVPHHHGIELQELMFRKGCKIKMGLDYTAGCINFRDVGEYVNWLADKKILPVNKLFRGGKTDFVKDSNEIGSPKTIINLRQGQDQVDFGVTYHHFPLANKVEKYHTEQQEVRKWLNSIVKLFEQEDLQYPVLIHCLSGKDRTGIAVAALLLIAGVRPEIIVQEYMISEGEVSEALIQIALKGMSQLHYFNRVDTEKVKRNLLKE